jgi:ATP-dependent helicase/nuclease subunit A
MVALTENQNLAATSIDESVLVAAGAGSGKTSTLVRRLVTFLQQVPESKISEILAVTFTRKAAAEMKTRLKGEISKLYAEADAEHRIRWARCLTEIDNARIGTIHSLCESILRNFSIESETDPHFEQMDDVQRAELYSESIEDTFREVIEQQLPEHELLMNFDIDAITRWLSNVLRSVSLFEQAVAPMTKFDQQQFATHLQSLLRRVQMVILEKLMADDCWTKAQEALQDAGDMQLGDKLEARRADTLRSMIFIANRISPRTSSEDIATCWNCIVSFCEPVGNIGKRNENADVVRGLLRQLRDQCLFFVTKTRGQKTSQIKANPSPQDEENWRDIQLVLSLAQRTIANYKEKKRAANLFDFDDLILQAHTTLHGSNDQVHEYYASQLRQICVDEFQDTNRLQAEIVNKLAGVDSKLFLIGDDKQSIYKFQGADVATFKRWQSSFEKDHLLVELSDSFRSHVNIVDFFNAIFEQLLSETTSPYAAIYRPLNPKLGDASENRVEVIAFQADEESTTSLEDREGRLVADWIRAKIAEQIPVKEGDSERPAGFGDFAILVQTNNESIGIERALAAAEIPYVKLGGQGYLQRQEVFDLENLLEFLHNTANSHALLGVLRSPIFCIADDMIHNIVATYPSTPLWEAMQRQDSKRVPGYELVSEAVSRLKRLIADASVQPLGELVRNIVRNTHYDLVLAQGRDGRQRSRNVWKFVDLASAHEEMSCGEFAKHIKSMRKLGVVQKDAPVDARNSVKIMTIHTSKGLEFPVVILPRLTALQKSFQNKLLFHREYGIAFDPTRNYEDPPPLFYELANWLEKDMEEAEKKRLLYVAMTRAKDHLALFFNVDGKRTASFGQWIRPLLFDPAQEPDVREAESIQRVAGSNARFKLFFPDLVVAPPKPESVVGKGKRKKDKGNQLSIFAATEAREKIEQETLSIPNCNLIEPLFGEPQEMPAVWLETTRITPRNNIVKFNQIVIGNYFHSLMESIPSADKIVNEDLMFALAQKQGTFVAHRDALNTLIAEGKRLLAKYFESPLFELVRTAQHRLHELPYFQTKEGEVDIKRPDLVLQDSNGNWYVVDYKTDDFLIAYIAKQAKQHRKQLDGYVTAIQKLGGFKATPVLYFAQHGILYNLDSSEEGELGR